MATNRSRRSHAAPKEPLNWEKPRAVAAIFAATATGLYQLASLMHEIGFF
ncbi:hypothetical protein ACWDUL_28050 [Nocardia niigatensis]